AILDDACLLAGDRAERAPEDARVLEADARDRHDRRIDHVRGVESSAEPHLDDGVIDSLAREMEEREAGHELEEGREVAGPRASALEDRQDLVRDSHEIAFGDRLAAAADPLAQLL